MSRLRPGDGIPVTVGGVEFHFLFTFAVIDDLQTLYKRPLSEIINLLTDQMTVYSAAGNIIAALIRSDLYNNGERKSFPSYDDVMHVLSKDDNMKQVTALLQCYGIDMPPNEDDDDDEESEPEEINIARLLVIARTELGMSEEEFWKTTPRKYFALFDEYVKLKTGGKKEGGSIDDLP